MREKVSVDSKKIRFFRLVELHSGCLNEIQY